MSFIHSQNSQLDLLSTRLPPPLPRDCQEIAYQGYDKQYGIYTIKPVGDMEAFQVSCDFDTDNKEWISLQRRFDGSVYFYRDWEYYKHGFGDLRGEHWLGLEKIHKLTMNGTWLLRIDLEDFGGNTAYQEYFDFFLWDEEWDYMLDWHENDRNRGTAGNSLGLNKWQSFSTYDHINNIGTRDRDFGMAKNKNCAESHQGAWWYPDRCGISNLNGLYRNRVSGNVSETGMVWYRWKNSYEVLKRSEMKIRRIDLV